MRFEDIVGVDTAGTLPARDSQRRYRIVNEQRVMVAAAAGLTAFAGTRFGLIKMIPAIGPIPAAAATIAVGVLLCAWVSKAGTVGAALEGIGYGLVAVGALELAAA